MALEKIFKFLDDQSPKGPSREEIVKKLQKGESLESIMKQMREAEKAESHQAEVSMVRGGLSQADKGLNNLGITEEHRESIWGSLLRGFMKVFGQSEEEVKGMDYVNLGGALKEMGLKSPQAKMYYDALVRGRLADSKDWVRGKGRGHPVQVTTDLLADLRCLASHHKSLGRRRVTQGTADADICWLKGLRNKPESANGGFYAQAWDPDTHTPVIGRKK